MASGQILLVDDDPTLSGMYADRLRAEGYTVTTAADGITGLEQAQKHPDLVLLDIMMPGMNGLDVLRKLKEDEKTEDIPVFLLTALIRELKQAKSIKGGAQGYFVKSDVVPGNMVKEINALLEKKSDKKKVVN